MFDKKITYATSFHSVLTLFPAFIFIFSLLLMSSSLESIYGASIILKPGVTPLIPIRPFMPSGVGIDPITDNIFITDSQNNLIKKFTNNGVLIKSWGGSGASNGKFSTPQDVAVDSMGNVFVTDGYNNRVQKFQLSNICPPGTIQITSGVCFVKSWGTYGSGDGEFMFPFGIDIDSTDNVFVVDAWNMRIQKFDNNGNFIYKWGNWGTGDGEFRNPDVIALDRKTNEVYVHDYDNYRIQKFDNNGNYIMSWGEAGAGDGQFGNVYGIAVDPKTGHVYVSNTNTAHIQKFTKNGGFVTSWGGFGTTNGNFNTQTDLGVDSSRDIFVADLNNHRIQEFDKNGNFISKWP